MVDYKPTLEDYERVGIKPIVPLKPGYVVKGINDKVFKNLANDVHTRRYFAKLISLSTGIDYDYLISNMKLSSNNTLEGSVYEHFNEQDVIVTLHDMRIDIEMSIDNKDYNVIKNQTTAFKLAGNTYKSGEKYYKTHIFYQICIEDYSIFKNDLLITKTKLVDISSGNYESETDEFIKFHVNLKNLDNSCYNESVKYFKFFTLNKISDLENLVEGDEILMDSLNELKNISRDSILMDDLERRELEEYCYKLAIMDAKNEGKDEGKQTGIHERNIEIAKKSLEQNIDINTISTITGLSIEEINKLIVQSYIFFLLIF